LIPLSSVVGGGVVLVVALMFTFTQKIEKFNPNHIPVFLTITFVDFDQLLLFFLYDKIVISEQKIIPDFCVYIK
jgi:hypothetical protein